MKIPISGMSCQSCASTIEDAVSRLPGAENVSANFALKQLIFDGVHLDTVKKTLRKLGYDSPDMGPAIFQVPEIQKIGSQELKEARTSFFIAFLLGSPEFVISMLGLNIPIWIQALISSAVVLGVGMKIHLRTFGQLRSGHVSMDTLVTLGSVAALVQSFMLWRAGIYNSGFEVGSTIIVFILFGKFLEVRSRKATYSATAEIFDLIEKPIIRIGADGEEEISGLQVRRGDRLRLLPGEVSPVDALVVLGAASISNSALTGESQPRTVSQGGEILSGALVIDSPIEVVAKRVGSDSFLGRLILELEKSQSQKIPMERLADKIMGFFVPVVIVLACLSALFHVFKGENPEIAFNVFLSVLLTACPCALGLAIPTALVAGLGASAKKGILFRDGAALENFEKIREIFFDKTGTLTEGLPQLIKIESLGGRERRDLLFYAVSLERYSLHPLSKAVIAEALKEKVHSDPKIDHFKVLPGLGVEGKLGEYRVKFIKGQPSELGTVSDLYINGQLEGRFYFNDVLRKEARPVLETLKSWGLGLHLLTGDGASAVKALHIDDVIGNMRSELLPLEKEKIVIEAKSKNPVAFVGDGINDVLALNAADIGIAVASGTPAALGAGSVSLVHGIADLPMAFHLGSRVGRHLRFNLGWALIYNVIMLPWAMTGGLNPMWASLAMAMSSVSVVLSSVYLGVKLRHMT